MKYRHFVRVGLLLAMMLCGACAMTPTTHFYTLHGFTDDAHRQSIILKDDVSYGIGPIFLPEALMQPGIVSHQNGQELKVSLYDIWAGNLRGAITRVIAANLSHITGMQAVWPFPWDNRNRPLRQVRVVFEQFSGELGGDVLLKAKWALTEQNGERALIERRIEMSVKAQGSSMGAYVSALNELINQLSLNIAKEIHRNS